jgi:hypothetical protein
MDQSRGPESWTEIEARTGLEVRFLPGTQRHHIVESERQAMASYELDWALHQAPWREAMNQEVT